MLLIACVLPAALSAAGAPAGSPRELWDPELLPLLGGAESRLFSSYDRTGGNNDGFDGLYSTVREEKGRWVVFDQRGPGAVKRIWFPVWSGLDADFEIEIDGRKAISAPNYRAFGDGSVYPFIKGLSETAMGGVVTCAPIPFRERCVISCSKPIFFYHFNYQLYPAGAEVETFDSPDYRRELEQAAEALMRPGECPGGLSRAARTVKTVTAAPGAVTDVFAEAGPGRVAGLKIRVEEAEELSYRSLWLKTRTDGIETVFAPMGDFFLDGFGRGGVRSLLFGSDNGEYYCWAPMPFAREWSLSVDNKGRREARLTVEIWTEQRDFPEGAGLFYGLWNRRKPASKDQKPFDLLNVKGRGRLISTGLYTDCRSGLACLEGDEIARIDGRDGSFYNGTGTEDCFGGGWYYSGEERSLPLYGCTYLAESVGRCSMYRLYTGDSVFFEREIVFDIERGAGNSEPAEYAGVTCFYAEPGVSWNIAHEGGWLPHAPGDPGVIEAEDAGAAGCEIIGDYGRPFELSRSEGVRATCFAVYYRSGLSSGVTLRIMGKARAVIDGKYVARIDAKTPETVQPFENAELPAGRHFLTILADEDPFVLDWFRPENAPGYHEGEALAYERSDGPFQAGWQDMKGFGPYWSADGHLFVKGEKPGDMVEYLLPAEPGEAFDLTVWLTTAPDYGILKIYADGTLLKEEDCYTPGVERREVPLGTVVPRDETVRLRLEVSGKNPASAGYYSGIDCLYQSKRGVEK
ncbi:MAG: DUF2961 domain-containing protein [Abditibacteriota bacterium]|nr:DUF2961 domain-containing protein [Abditibacteriota bacterium]